jgi:hypothetical protein
MMMRGTLPPAGTLLPNPDQSFFPVARAHRASDTKVEEVGAGSVRLPVVGPSGRVSTMVPVEARG